MTSWTVSRCPWREGSGAVPSVAGPHSAAAGLGEHHGCWHDTAVSTVGSPGRETSADRPRIALVVNPAAGRGNALATAVRVVAALGEDSVRLVNPGPGSAASVRAISLAATDSDAVWVCGGDGMVHLAVNVLAGTGVPLGIVPAGTGNDAAAVIGLDRDPIVAARTLLAATQTGSVDRVDLGHCDGPPLVPGGDGRWFLGMLYAGLDSAVNERANALRWPHGRHKYNVAIGLEMLRLRPSKIEIRLDDQEFAVESTLVAIGNGPGTAGGRSWCPMPAGMTVLRHHLGRPGVPFHVGQACADLAARWAYRSPGRPAIPGQDRRLRGEGPIAYADGERVGPLPVVATCVPQALSVLVPPNR